MSKKLTLLYTALLMATAILAQQDTSTHPLDEVVVTANKIAQKQSTTGKVVSVISKDQIEKSGSKTVSQLLNEQAGVVITGALQPLGSVQTLNLNGATSGHTLILIDGIPVSDPSDINNNFDLNFLSLTNVERIEILKGAQSTLYGSDAVAGVINIITKKDGVNKPIEGQASISNGSLNTYKSNIGLDGKLNKFSYDVGYAKTSTDGFAAGYDSSGKGNFKKDGYNGENANASILYRPNKEWDIKAYTKYSDYKAGFSGAFANDTNYTNDYNFLAGTGFQFKKEAFSLTGNYQYNTVTRNLFEYGSLSSYNSHSDFAELYANIKLGSGFSLLSGVDYRYGQMNEPYATDTSIHQTSVYSSLYYNSSHFNVELGGRYNSNSRYGNNNTFTFNPSYIINDHYRIFGSIASGFKAPTLYQLYAGFGSGNINLQPEKSINYEVGVQGQYKGFSDRLLLFYRDLTDAIDYNNNTFQYFNYASQTVRGIQYEISVKPVKQVTVTGNYTYISASQSTESRLTNNDTTYSYSLRIPKHAVNITIGYQIIPSLYVSVSGKYISKRYDAAFDANYDPLPDATLDAYTIFGASARYIINKHIKLFADGQNITNKKFFDVYGYNSIPDLFNGGVTVNW
jgi:vitamin B12 transporter